MSISDLKKQARQAIHGSLGEPALYTPSGAGAVTHPTDLEAAAGLELTVRWHHKLKIVGERGQDDVGVIEGINRLVFNTEQLTALGLTLTRNGTLTVPGFGKSFRLDYHEEPDGPLNDYWSVIEIPFQAPF